MAIPVALLVGFAAVVGMDYLSSSMRLEPRIEEALGLPIIGRIPCQTQILTADWEELKQTVGKSAPSGSVVSDVK